MAVRDGDDEEPAGSRPLPPEDRVWRHPSEIAWEADQRRRRRRRRRRHAGATMVTGAAALGLVWLAPSTSSPEPAEVAGISSTPIGAADRTTTTTARIAAVPTSTTVAVPAPASTTAPPPSSTLPEAEAVQGAPDPTDRSPGPVVVTVRSTVDDTLLGGAIVVRDGYLVSSTAALAGADAVVARWGEEERQGVVLGHDEVTDVSVIELEAPGPDPAGVDATAVAVGDAVDLADPGGDHIRRTVAAARATATTSEGTTLIGVVELDAARGTAPPGSPARSPDGSVVGMTTATDDDAPAAVVPIDTVREVAEEIIRTGQASHPWLGLTAGYPAGDGEKTGIGAVVTELVPDGPAALGGVLVDDLIVAIDAEPVDGPAGLVTVLRNHEPGDRVSVLVDRDGVSVDCRVVLDSHLTAAA